MCFLCGAGCEGALCHDCLTDLPYNDTSCPICALPTVKNHVCSSCLQHPPSFQNCFTVCTYEYPIDALICEMKFRQRPEIAYALVRELYSRQLGYPGSRPDVIIPVPMHKRRMMQRGYNQALELSRAINKYSGIPVDSRSCRRARYTVPQINVPAKQRKTNVRSVFKISGPINYRYAMIVDDVITTGSTVNEIASLLIRTGVKRVCVWALARAGFNKMN